MCTQDGIKKKGCYLPPVTYLGIVSIPDHTGCLVRLLNPPWNHPLWYDYLHLSGAYVCFTTQGRLFCFPKSHFSEQEHIIFVGLFTKICNTHICYPKYDCNLWLYSTLTEAEFNGKKLFPETAPGWEKYTVPWLPFLSQVSLKQITRGSGTWYTDYRL